MNKTEFFYLVAGFLAGFFIRHFFQDLVKESEPEETYPQSPIELESNPKDLVVSQETIPLPDIAIRKIFIASRLGDPLTPDEGIVNITCMPNDKKDYEKFVKLQVFKAINKYLQNKKMLRKTK